MTTTVNKFRIYCATEAAHKYQWRAQEDGELEVCPDNAEHIVQEESAAITESVSTDIQKDEENAPIQRLKMAPSGWTYHIRGIEYQTSTSGSLKNNDHNGNGLGDATLKFYDSQGVETSDMSQCVKTVLDVEPAHDYEIIGGTAKFLGAFTEDMYMDVIAVPDIPANQGGSKIMVRNINARFVGTEGKIEADGRVSKLMTYSATYHTNKLRFIARHPAGYAQKTLVMLEMYKE
jgi:hypothetical protein